MHQRRWHDAKRRLAVDTTPSFRLPLLTPESAFCFFIIYIYNWNDI